MAHGQPSEPAPPEAALAKLAERVASHLPGWRVRSATMAAPGRLEEEAAALADGALVYPFFMAGGYFVTGVLPGRIDTGRLNVLDPLGLEPGLPAVAVAALGAGPRQVVLAAHGSARGKAAGEAAWSFAERLARLMPQTAISLGFVEQAPGVAEAAGGLDNDAVCLPWLAFPGGHFQEDVPQALAEAGFSGRLLPVLGLAEGVPALIAASLLAASQKDIAA